MKPRLVVFDLGGVVVRICRSWKEACAVAGLRYDERAVAPEAVAARKAIVHRHEVGGMTCQEYFEALAATTAGVHTPEEIQRLHDLWITAEYEGVDRLIHDLHAAGLETGVLSNTNAWHWRQLMHGPHGPAKFPTVGLARHVHASHLLGHRKPDRAVFDAFCRVTGFSGPDIHFFDDLPENIAAAHAAGWGATLIDPHGDPAAQMRTPLRGIGVPLAQL